VDFADELAALRATVPPVLPASTRPVDFADELAAFRARTADPASTA
jgi:hypothetical protein